MNVLYLSYDGMTDPLGQSQVIPYLAGLSKEGLKITLISFEKKDRYKLHKDLISGLLNRNGINWVPLSYTKSPPVLSTMWDLFKLKRKINKLLREKKYDVVHCRSYISAIAGLELKRKHGIKFIFDMRGFWADERVEGGLWNLRNPLYKIVYDYFKKKEKDFLREADQVISLTEHAKLLIDSWKLRGEIKMPITVIPCCADLDHFSSGQIIPEKMNNWKLRLGIKEKEHVVGYLGAIGTWYMLDEMLDFFKCYLEVHPDAKFLFITQEPETLVFSAAAGRGIPADRILVTPASRSDLPSVLGLLSFSVFFIRPSFSKGASSPTKQGELMGMGIPIICNSGIGDTDKIIEDTRAGLIVRNFSKEDYFDVIERLGVFIKKNDHENIVAGARKYYSLEKGVSLFKSVYEQLKLNMVK